MKNYIEYDNKNSMHNEGHLTVYVNGENVEMIFVDDFIEQGLPTKEFKKHYDVDEDEVYGVYDIIELLKKKYNIEKVEIHQIDWR